MNHWQAVVLAALPLLLVASPVHAQRRDRDPMQDARWEKAVANKILPAEDLERLGKQKVLITNEAYKQVFSAYMGGRLPLFITSDSLLNAYHVLYEESIVRMEQANALRLSKVLGLMWKHLPEAGKNYKGRPELVAAARKRAQIVIGTALRLTGDTTLKPAPEVAALIDEEVKRIESAAGQLKPKWLGPPDAGFLAIDYTRYKPRGFYTRSEHLQRYFRAVSWLQSIPFRVANDEELVAILMIAGALEDEGFGVQMEAETFFEVYAQFLGTGDDWSFTDLWQEAHNNRDLNLDPNAEWGSLTRLRKGLKEDAARRREAPQINDQVALPPDNPSAVAEPNFRILSAIRTPDAVLFQRSTDLRRFARDFPSGLEVCTALGSTYARSQLTGADRDKLLETIDACAPLFGGHTLYARYLDCLRALLDKPDPDAPAFMNGDAWQIKSCGTALAGWAQLRHTWALQAKQTVHYAGETMQPAGFVEPDPEFFRRMASLTGETEILLKEAGALEPDRMALADDLKRAAAIIRKLDFTKKDDELFKEMGREEMMVLERIGTIMMVLEDRAGMEDRKKWFTGVAVKLDRLGADLASGKMPDDAMVLQAIRMSDIDLAALWRGLHEVCLQLESLAHKQLRGMPFNPEEEGFIRRYGSTIAGIMLYGGNAYLTPNDDAPRVVDVYANPNSKDPNHTLEVGVARARAIYVLYPWKGQELVCKGAVMPYYEFRHPARLTDAEWKRLLDSPERPDVPAWLKPIIASKGLGKPELTEEH